MPVAFYSLQEDEKSAKKKAVAAGLQKAQPDIDLEAEEEVRPWARRAHLLSALLNTFVIIHVYHLKMCTVYTRCSSCKAKGFIMLT